MEEIVTTALELLHTDKTIIDVLRTLSATATSLSDKVLNPVEFWALTVVTKAAEKKIQEIIQNKQ